MISEWVLGSFKSISDPVRLEMAPLTLICGANSSGKSTLIQSILLIAQTLGSPATDRPLILNGELVKLGFPIDLLHCGNDKSELEIGFALSAEREDNRELFTPKVTTSFRSSIDPVLNTRKMILISTLVQSEMGNLKLFPESEGNRLSRIVRQSAWNIPASLKTDIETGMYDFRLEVENKAKDNKRKDYYASITHFLPSQLIAFESVEDFVKQIIQDCARDLSSNSPSSPVHLDLKSPNGRLVKEIITKAIEVAEKKLDVRSEYTVQGLNQSLSRLQRTSDLDEWLDSMQKQTNAKIRNALAMELTYYISRPSFEVPDTSNRSSKSLRPDVLLPHYQLIINNVVTTFSKKLHYLGPLRDDPKMIYGLPPIPDSKEVGNKGEFTAAVLERFGNADVQCPLPPQDDPLEITIRSMHLIDAVTVWLNHMGLVKKVQTKDEGKMGVQLSIQVEGLEQSVDLTNVGVGVSQILPILVSCLLADKNSIILLEQPELHLHPKVQMMLGDFFLGIAKSGKQCIIETHSDRLINRVRRRIAEAKGTSVMNLTRMFFAEKEGAVTHIIKVEPNEYGAIPDWPKGFFDEGPDEAQRIIDAASRKRDEKIKNAELMRNRGK